MVEGGNNITTTTMNTIHQDKYIDLDQWLEDIFDIFDDDDNNDNSTTGLETIMEDYNRDFDFEQVYSNLDEEEMVTTEPNTVVEQEEEEEVLSQKLSQLSTAHESDLEEEEEAHLHSGVTRKRVLNASSLPDVVRKKSRIEKEGEGQARQQLPDYLQTANEVFHKFLTKSVKNNTTTADTAVSTEDVRKLIALKHKIAVTTIDEHLWQVYLKSGTGQLQTEENCRTVVLNRQLWPAKVEQALASKLKTLRVGDSINDQPMYEKLVHEHLRKLQRTIKEYQNELDETRKSLLTLTTTMENAMDELIEKHATVPLQMKLQCKMATLEYDYDAQLLEREYLQLEPTEQQIEAAQRLYNLRYEHLQAKQELIELKQQVLCGKPTIAMSSTSLSSMPSADATTNEQDKVSDTMAVSINKVENKIHACRASFNREIRQISGNDSTEGLPSQLVDLIHRRFNIIKKKIESIGHFRVNYFLRNHYGNPIDTAQRSSIQFSPTIVIDTSSHQLTQEQLRLLNRGPTYVPPCQPYVSSSSPSSSFFIDMILKDYKVLQHHLSVLYAKRDVNTARGMFLNKEIKDAFIDAFSVSLPPSMHRRALYEKQLVQSIQEHLERNHLLLRRTADQKNVFYLGDVTRFEEKVHEFMMNTDAYEVTTMVDDDNMQRTHEYMAKLIQSMNSELEKIFNNKKIYKEIVKRLHIDKVKVEMSYLYFLPYVCQDKLLSVKPVVTSRHSVTCRLAYFLNELLQPVIQRHSNPTTFVNGSDFIQKLDRYTNDDHRLRASTIFATISISNYDSIVPHQAMLTALEDFLNDRLAIPAIQCFSVKTILELTTLFLNSNRFYYEKRIYRFLKGGPNNLPLCRTLWHIYTFQWQSVLMKQKLLEKELFGRCQDQIFFTWNSTTDSLRQFLKTVINSNKDMQLEVKIGSKMRFLSAWVQNLNGTLYSRVYHDPSCQKYTLPYVVGHAKIAHSHWLRSALIRTVRYCTSVDDFNKERIYLELTCLANGYSVEFIERRVNHFYNHFDAASLRFFLDQHVYNKLRHRLFNFIHEQRQFLERTKELEKSHQRLHLIYPYQFGSKHKFNDKLKQILHDSLNQHVESSKDKVEIVLTTIQQHSLNALLSQQKPAHKLLSREKTLF